MKKTILLIALASFVVFSVHAETKRAAAVIGPTFGNETWGTITFEEDKGMTSVKGQIRGISEGAHGFHIHEFGNCISSDGSSAGDHFNPTQHNHGDLKSGERHAGDFGNIEAKSDRTAEVNLNVKELALNGPHSIIGRAIIVHESPDDLTTQPSGNSGKRIGCGVIGISK